MSSRKSRKRSNQSKYRRKKKRVSVRAPKTKKRRAKVKAKAKSKPAPKKKRRVKKKRPAKLKSEPKKKRRAKAKLKPEPEKKRRAKAKLKPEPKKKRRAKAKLKPEPEPKKKRRAKAKPAPEKKSSCNYSKVFELRNQLQITKVNVTGVKTLSLECLAKLLDEQIKRGAYLFRFWYSGRSYYTGTDEGTLRSTPLINAKRIQIEFGNSLKFLKQIGGPVLYYWMDLHGGPSKIGV